MSIEHEHFQQEVYRQQRLGLMCQVAFALYWRVQAEEKKPWFKRDLGVEPVAKALAEYVTPNGTPWRLNKDGYLECCGVVLNGDQRGRVLHV